MGVGRTAFPGEWRKSKKEEFPGIMENMLPGNSFPQICVVSVYSLWETGPLSVVNIAQGLGYGRSKVQSNLASL